MKKLFAVMIFLAMLCGAVNLGTGSFVYAGGTAPMDTRVERP